MLRRELLKPSVALAAEWFGAFDLPEGLPPELALFRCSRRAMATLFEIFLPFSFSKATMAADEAFDLIDEIEARLTVYNDESEISLVNREAAAGPVQLSPELFGLVQRAARISRSTQGCFDPATGAMTKAWGFFKREGRVPEPAERIAAMQRSGMRHVIIDDATRTVKFRVPGIEFNFGGIGKGYAVDRCANLLTTRWGVLSALMHGGSSSVRAIGSPAGQSKGWPIAVKHPWQPERPLGTLWLKDAGMGTSAATFQYFDYNGKKLGHVLDPRKGWPADSLSLASVVAPTAEEADALSTAFFVMGLDAAVEYGRTHPEITALLLAAEPDAELVTVNLPATGAAFTPIG